MFAYQTDTASDALRTWRKGNYACNVSAAAKVRTTPLQD